MSEVQTRETRSFQAETKQLLDLMIHSVYTNREIFLRELISNASDAIDKIRFQSLTNLELLEGDSEFEIYLEVNEDNRTLSINDNGIGMTYEEVVENIGTIAKSGTRVFLEKMRDNGSTGSPDSMEMIGQFGVGFYSAFMIAEKVILETKAPGEARGVRWESAGDGTYTIEYTDQKKRGTTITLYMREEQRDPDKPEEDFLNRYTIQNLVKKYSDYIRYPIKMNFYREEKPRDEKGEIIEDAAPTVHIDTRTMNSMLPLWEKNKKEITSEDYFRFYKNVFHDWNEPLEIIHSKVEGKVEYTTLLFIPSRAPYDFYSRDYDKGISLYSRHVFVMDNCRELLPDYLKFVRGLVDSPDFSLNISREILQHSKQLKLIGKNLEESVLKTLKNLLANDRKKYEEFWQEFGKAIKGGIYMDYKVKEKLQDLLIFPSSQTEDGLVTLEEYAKRMPENQDVIYYAAGKDRAAVERLPQMEILREKNLEVLYFFDKIDEFIIDSLNEYNGKKFKSISRGDLDLPDDKSEDEKKAQEETTRENEGLLEAIKKHLGEKVSDVRISNRLKNSAVCLVSGDAGISLAMEQILTDANQLIRRANRILELNPTHPVFDVLKKLHETDPESDTLKDYSELLFAQASLVEGFTLDNPVEFADKLARLMVQAKQG